MVSVFEGRLARTWYYKIGVRNHVITLFHDTITGLRSAMLDFEEIPRSRGNSSLLMDSSGHRIFFEVEGESGYIEIKRAGWTTFSYKCVIKDLPIVETTETVAYSHEEMYQVKLIDMLMTKDEFSEFNVMWYVVKTTRLHDKVTTTVHR